MFDLITIGDTPLDSIVLVKDAQVICRHKKKDCVLCFGFGEKIPIDQMVQAVGGNAANVAIGAKKLGLAAIAHTFVGDDLIGDIIRSEFQEQGLSTSLVYEQKNAESNYSIILNYSGERTIFSYHGIYKYKLGILPKTKWIYYTSLGKKFEKLQKELLRHLKKNPRIKLAMNPGSYQLKYGLSHMQTMLPFVDILFVNVEEAQRLINRKASIKSCAKSLHAQGVKLVVITDGSQGSYTFDGVRHLFHPVYPIPSLSRTGAGDAYASGFLSAIINKKSIAEAMSWGTANAGGVIQKIGAHAGLLNTQSLQKMIKSYRNYTLKSL